MLLIIHSLFTDSHHYSLHWCLNLLQYISHLTVMREKDQEFSTNNVHLQHNKLPLRICHIVIHQKQNL